MKSTLSSQARRELDRRFKHADIGGFSARPHRGWIRAIRSALGMSQASLGARLGVTNSAVAQLEHAEVTGGITIAKLRSVAEALDCALVYALVPNTSLESTLMGEARRVAAERVGYVASTMALEDQAVDQQQASDQLEAIARELIAANEVWKASRR